MRHGSLFSGIGGFDLAAEWMGWENIFHCEWNPFGQKILKHYWPKSISYDDITKTDFSIHRGSIDILTGGFPCQPYSVAGKRKGKDDDRHLWPEMLRAIREIQPTWIVGENVRGLTNWNGGLVFNEVQADLEALGYEVQPFLLPACSVNAPHRRDRIWFIAYSKSFGGGEGIGKNVSDGEWTPSKPLTEKGCLWKGFEAIGGTGVSANATGLGLQRGSTKYRFCNKQSEKFFKISNGKSWENFPSQPSVCNGDDGLSERLDSITFPKWRNESIKGGGNAIVPQVAHQIFKAIEQYERNTIPFRKSH